MINSNSYNGTLYIIGNGFDCAHGLNTDVKAFIKILKTKEIYNEPDSADYILEYYGVLWNDFESALANIDIDAIAEEHIIAPDYHSEHEYDRDAGIANMEMYTQSISDAIRESLITMVDRANLQLVNKQPVFIDFLQPNDMVLSFNYTSTIEQLYCVPSSVKICHIHGLYENNGELILGYRDGVSEAEFNNTHFASDELNIISERKNGVQKDTNLTADEKKEQLAYFDSLYDEMTRDRDYYVDEQWERVFSFYHSLKKPIQIERLRKFLLKCQSIERVVVMGHSMGIVDRDYFEEIERTICPKEWKISLHNSTPSNETIGQYSFHNKVSYYDLSRQYSK